MTKTKRVVIIGTESSHARAFAKLLENNRTVKLVGACGNEEKANEAFTAAFGVECTSDPAALAELKPDGALITARDGASHLALARPYLKPGMTLFVDKPLCNAPEEAEELLALAKENGVKLCGGSSLKFAPAILRLREEVRKADALVVGGSFSAPVEMESVYGGFFFYAPHLIEMALTVFGDGIRSVRAIRHGDSATALLCYDGFCVSLFFGCDAYSASVSFRTYEKHGAVALSTIPKLYAKELSGFCGLLTGRISPRADEIPLTAHVVVANAIKRAYETGNEVFLRT